MDRTPPPLPDSWRDMLAVIIAANVVVTTSCAALTSPNIMQPIKAAIRRHAPFLAHIARELANRRKAARAVRTFRAKFLEPKGWPLSSVHHRATDATGKSIPWITYPALHMLERIAKSTDRVFEYGCGDSSLWWAARVASIHSVEHNQAWADEVSKRKPQNMSITVRKKNAEPDAATDLIEQFFRRFPNPPTYDNEFLDENNGTLCREYAAYAAEVATHPRGSFDIVVVDGMARSLTAWMAIHYVKEDGFILFDNSDRPQYAPAFELLREAGFKRIDFFGPGPVLCEEWCTSIFCKNVEWLS